MQVLFLLCVSFIYLVGSLETEKTISTFGYHENYGIPWAKEIKETEEFYMKSGARVVGGSVAPNNAYPYMGGLIIHLNHTDTPSVCGSTLLSSNRLVTAAHCWYDGRNRPLQFDVVLGSNMLFFGGTRITTSEVVMHPLWSASGNSNDVAVIYLPEDVVFSQSVQPVVLPSSALHEESFAGWDAKAAGFGRKRDGASVYLEMQLHHVDLKVISVEECADVYGNTTVTDATICTSGEGGIGVCQGDSGGPLVVTQNGKEILVGISIFAAARSCRLGFPSGYARVTSYYNFILRNMW